MPKTPITVQHGCARNNGEPYVPQVCRVIDIQEQTHDVKSFRLQTLDGKRPFSCEPGQLGMFSDPPYGECMFAVAGVGEDYCEFIVKNVGFTTNHLHELSVGDEVGLRGPYGNWFPYESAKGRDMLFIGGGIGMPPVRAFLRHCLEYREDYGRIDFVYSASTYDDLVCKDDLFNVWPNEPDTHVHVSVYHATEGDGWEGAVSYTAPYLEQVFAEEGLSTDNACAVLCGGPSLFRTCRESLLNLGFAPEDIVTTLEARMKCGVGKCGRCNVGGVFICLEGPVFTEAELARMPRD